MSNFEGVDEIIEELTDGPDGLRFPLVKLDYPQGGSWQGGKPMNASTANSERVDKYLIDFVVRYSASPIADYDQGSLGLGLNPHFHLASFSPVGIDGVVDKVSYCLFEQDRIGLHVDSTRHGKF